MSSITGFIYEGLSPVIMSVIEIEGYDIVWFLKMCSFTQSPASESRVAALFLIQNISKAAATILFFLPAYKYAIMVRLLSSLLGWLEWRLRLSGHSNVGLMVLTCVGHRWSPVQP